MGEVAAENMLGKSYEHPVLTSLKKPKLPDMVELPLVIVNGTFRCLDTLREYELEDFLRYLCKYTAEKEKRSLLQKPVWWIDDVISHSSDFVNGGNLIFVKNKICRMRQLVENAYLYYSSKKLLDLSSKFSRMHVLSLQFKICSDGSVVVINKSFGNILVRIPVSNMEYDFDRQKKKDCVLSEVQLIEVITLDDEEPEKKSHVMNHVPTKEDLRIYKSSSGFISKNPQVDHQINDCANQVVVLSDSDDEVAVKQLPQALYLGQTANGKCKFKRKLKGHSSTSRKKKLTLMEKLHNLQKTSSISFYPCINISDDDDDEEEDYDDDEDCQIIETKIREELTSNFKKIDDRGISIDNEKTDQYHEKNFDESVSTTSILSNKEEFLYNIGLINKENMEQMKSFVQSKQPIRKLRRLKLPQYYMPLEILPLLVSRGVISSTKFKHNPNHKFQSRKQRKQRKLTRRHIPPEVELKDCHVVLTRLPKNILDKLLGNYKVQGNFS